MVNQYEGEALSAVMPAAALQQLWEIVGVVEKALMAVSALVVLVGLTGMMVALMTSINERRREMAILRAVGARPAHVMGLIVGEAALVSLSGVGVGFILLYVGLLIARPIIVTRTGLFISIGVPSLYEWGLGAVVVLAGLVIGLVPAYRGYRYSLSDGLMVRT